MDLSRKISGLKDSGQERGQPGDRVRRTMAEGSRGSKEGVRGRGHRDPDSTQTLWLASMAAMIQTA